MRATSTELQHESASPERKAHHRPVPWPRMSAHSMLVKQLPCLACEQEGVAQPYPTEAHHQNLGGKAGQKRLGDAAQIPLCAWHHRGTPPAGMTRDDATYHYGPSLALSSKMYRFTYGSDEQQLLATQARLEREGLMMGVA
jgi:hypothetical protein